MNDYPTTLRVIAAFKAGEDLAQRLESAVKAQNAMADALRNAADEIERLEELRKLDGESMGVLISECQDMKDRLVNGDFIERLRDGAVDARETVQQEPVAWANFYPDEEFVDFDRGCVEKCSDEGEVFPLYRDPQSCPHVRGTVTQHCSLNTTLTDAEREAVEVAIIGGCEMAATLRKLLERLA